MAKMESSFKNMLIVLSVVSLLASAILGIVYELTAEPIALAKKQKEDKAILEVIPIDKSNIEKMQVSTTTKYISKTDDKILTNDEKSKLSKNEIDSLILFYVKVGEDTIGTAVKTYTNKGFSGRFTVMVGFMKDGSISNTKVLEHRETPGLGTKMMLPGFKNQFNGKIPGQFKLAVKKKGGDVDGITAATISSSAFCDAIRRASNAIKQ